jgi:hypothetical protein
MVLGQKMFLFAYILIAQLNPQTNPRVYRSLRPGTGAPAIFFSRHTNIPFFMFNEEFTIMFSSIKNQQVMKIYIGGVCGGKEICFLGPDISMSQIKACRCQLVPLVLKST